MSLYIARAIWFALFCALAGIETLFWVKPQHMIDGYRKLPNWMPIRKRLADEQETQWWVWENRIWGVVMLAGWFFAGFWLY